MKRLRHSKQLPRPQHPEAANPEQQKAFQKTLETLMALRQVHPEKRIWLCFQDEARFGLKPTYRSVWAPIGQRPAAPSRTRYEWSYVFATVHPASGTTHALNLFCP